MKIYPILMLIVILSSYSYATSVDVGEVRAGETLELGLDDDVSFVIKNDRYNLIVDEIISDSSAKLIINPGKIITTIKGRDSQAFDLDNDRYDDVQIKLEGVDIENKKIELNIRELFTVKKTTTTTTSTTSTTITLEKENNEEKNDLEGITGRVVEEQQTNYDFLGPIIAALIVIVGLSIFFLFRKDNMSNYKSSKLSRRRKR